MPDDNTLAKAPSGSIDFRFKLLLAVAIVMVVANHCYHGGTSLLYEWFPAYSFHVPLLIFISGYFYKPEYESSPFKYILKRAKRLLLPAYLWNIAYGGIALLLSTLGYTMGTPVTAFKLFVSPFIDGEALRYNLGSWFVYPLFLVSVVNMLTRKLLKRFSFDCEYFLTIIYLGIGMLGIKLAIDGHNQGVMLLVTRSMFFLPCLQFGRLYRAKLEKADKMNSALYFSILLIASLMLHTFCNKLEYAPSKMTGFENGVVIPYLSAIIGIAFWLRVCALAAPAIKNRKPILLVANNTYSIMIHQFMGFMVVKWLFLWLDTVTGIFPDFDIEKLHSSIFYYYLPKGITQYALLYVAAGIFVPIAIQKGVDAIKKPIKKRFEKRDRAASQPE